MVGRVYKLYLFETRDNISTRKGSSSADVLQVCLLAFEVTNLVLEI